MISFTKMHGLGNDYIYIELLEDKNIIAQEEFPSLARFLCNRHFGVGADGVIFIDKSNVADFKMIIYNPDGSKAQMCGNGIRCFAKYVYESNLTIKTTIDIETDSGIRRAFLKIERNEVSEVTICMGKPILDTNKLKQLGFINNEFSKTAPITIEDKSFTINPVSMGNPHAVIFVGKVDSFNVSKYGKLIENNSCFPEKTNVEFVQIIDRGHIKLRVWERGVGETYACGTGACAAVSVCISKRLTRNLVTVNLKGGDLKINWNAQDNNIYMSGIATKVFEGKIGN